MPGRQAPPAYGVARRGYCADVTGFDIAVLDVDGTLVDSNYHHTRAWQRAFREVGLAVPAWRIHRSIGMGGDRLVSAVAGESVEHAHGDRLRATWKRELDGVIHEIAALEGATDLLDELRHRGLKIVLASSGDPDHLEHALDVVDARPRIDGVVSSKDVKATKPSPDLLSAAVDSVGGASAVVIGDTVWDAEAARRAGLRAVGVLTGGFSRDELLDAGAAEVYADLPDLVEDLDVVLTPGA